jgi:hypothetical protein
VKNVLDEPSNDWNPLISKPIHSDILPRISSNDEIEEALYGLSKLIYS